MQTKAWAVDELTKAKKTLGIVYIVYGNLGLLGPLLFAETKLKIKKVRSFDADPTCEPIADQINIEKVIFDWHYKAITKDPHDIDYIEHVYDVEKPGGYYDDKKKFIANKPVTLCEIPDTIINTSCDQMHDFKNWWEMIPKGKLVLLQNNDFQADKSTSTARSLKIMMDRSPMTKLMFSGERDYAKYKQFMLIGIK
jgi:hypothetical protein